MLSDTLTLGLVLLLLFGSIVLYLYTCIQQSEQKISLLESILLDLKMSTEIKAYTELPIESSLSNSSSGGSSDDFVMKGDSESRSTTPATVKEESNEQYVPFDDDAQETLPASNDDIQIDIGEYKSVIADAVEEDTATETTESSVNYESMSLKELQALAKTRGIVGVTKKGPLIEALKTSDRSSAVKPGALSSVGSNSFLETSANVSDETA
jgi:hypothetical protein